MYSAGLSQKVAAQFRETGRHGLGSHIHGVAACVECADAPLSELRKAFSLRAMATVLTGVIVPLSQSSRKAQLRA